MSINKFKFFFFRKTLPKLGELNIHFGVFLGGLGDFSESYLNSVDNFRGCMSDVNHFNNIGNNIHIMIYVCV